eukprot:4662466-Prorocentrum_lima.AAC.1
MTRPRRLLALPARMSTPNMATLWLPLAGLPARWRSRLRTACAAEGELAHNSYLCAARHKDK